MFTILLDFVRWVIGLLYMLAGWNEPLTIKVYPTLRGFSKPVKKRLQTTVDRFHEAVHPRTRVIIGNNKAFGVHIDKTQFGDGLFNGSARMPRGVFFAIYISSISHEAWYNRDGDATYGFGIGRMFGYECVLDGRFFIYERQSYNGSFLNHSCTPNSSVEIETEPSTGVQYLTFVTLRDVARGEQLLIDYNRDMDLLARGGYWEHISFLADVPEWALCRCGCAVPAAGSKTPQCPKQRAFDLRTKRPSEAAAILAAQSADMLC